MPVSRPSSVLRERGSVTGSNGGDRRPGTASALSNELLNSPVMDPADMARRIREQRARAQEEEEQAVVRAEQNERLEFQRKMTALQNKHGAANSHVQNDAYMAEFERAWQQMQIVKGESTGSAGPQPLLLGEAKTGVRPDSRQGLSAARTRNLINHGKTTALANLTRHPAHVLDTWHSGPEDPAGKLCDVSDRPTLCSAANWAKGEVVVGSSDHALYIIDAEKGTKKRQLYNKTNGHEEWVSAVCYTPDGKIVSGGMDSKLWLWPFGTTRGMQLEGHFGPISQLAYDGSSGLVVSASYDKTVRLWLCGARGEQKGALMGHDAPVMQLDISSEGKIVTGDRSGHIILWDTTASEQAWRMKNVHKGQVSALAWCDQEDSDLGGLFISGGQDGIVRVWDHRARSCPQKVQLHVNKQGQGAVSSICAGGLAAAHQVVTSGADMTLRVLEPRKSFALMHTVELSNYPYSMAVAGGFALVGCGDGALYVVDIRDGTVCYALGAHKGAVRCIEACADRLFTSGDDGNTLLWRFPAISSA